MLAGSGYCFGSRLFNILIARLLTMLHGNCARGIHLRDSIWHFSYFPLSSTITAHAQPHSRFHGASGFDSQSIRLALMMRAARPPAECSFVPKDTSIKEINSTQMLHNESCTHESARKARREGENEIFSLSRAFFS